MEKPAVKGERVQIHLSPGGQLASFRAKLIDWPATERFNAPPAPAPKPAPAPEPVVTTLGSTLTAGTVTTTGGILQLKLIGGGHAQAITSVDGSGAQDSGGEGAAAPAKPTDPNATAGALAGLTREFADLKSTRDEAAASKASVEAQIADLQSRSANAAPAGVNYNESPTQKALAQAKETLQALSDQIALIEKRMSAVRARAIDLGGSIE